MYRQMDGDGMDRNLTTDKTEDFNIAQMLQKKISRKIYFTGKL